MRKVAVALMVLCLLVPLAVAADFGFGITPNLVDGGEHKPGTSFYDYFYVFSSSDSELSVDVSVQDPGIEDFRAVRGEKIVNFSEQECESCLEILQGEGTIEERDNPIGSGGRQTYKWSRVEFIVELPDDMEPGYHMFELVPRPDREGGGGSVNVVSASSVPVIFRVPGEVNREGEILGMSSRKDKGGYQVVTASFYNSGTVTIEANVKIEIEGKDGNTITMNAGSQAVGPGETEEFPVSVEPSEIGDEFEATAIVDYTTGEDEKSSLLEKKTEVKTSEVEEKSEEGSNTYMRVVIFLLLSTALTIGVIRYVNR